MAINPKVTCDQCGKPFTTYDELAIHILSEEGHKKSRRWALKYKARNIKRTRVEYKKVGDDPDKETTDYGEENRQNMKRKLSGENSFTNAVCPKCHKKHAVTLECEYVKSPSAWRIDNKLVKLCGGGADIEITNLYRRVNQ